MDGGERGGRPARSPLSGTLWAPNRVLRDRLRKNRDSQRLALSPGSPVQVFGKVQFAKRRLYLRLLEVRKLRGVSDELRDYECWGL